VSGYVVSAAGVGIGEERVTIDQSCGCERLEQRVISFAPGRSDERLTGERQEVLYVAAGRGQLHVDGKSHELEPDTGAFLVPGDSFAVESRWQASLRGRIGYAAWDRSLLYVTGGAAWTNFKGTVGLVGLGTFTGDRTITGGTVGLGYEYAFTNNISLGIEGRWSFYGDRTFNSTLGGIPVSDKVSLDTAEVMGKLNFRFGGIGGY